MIETRSHPITRLHSRCFTRFRAYEVSSSFCLHYFIVIIVSWLFLSLHLRTSPYFWDIPYNFQWESIFFMFLSLKPYHITLWNPLKSFISCYFKINVKFWKIRIILHLIWISWFLFLSHSLLLCLSFTIVYFSSETDRLISLSKKIHTAEWEFHRHLLLFISLNVLHSSFLFFFVLLVTRSFQGFFFSMLPWIVDPAARSIVIAVDHHDDDDESLPLATLKRIRFNILSERERERERKKNPPQHRTHER